MASVHPVSYYLPPRDKKRPPREHMRRDLGAALELVAALMRLGYGYGEPIVNAPPINPRAKRGPSASRKIDLSFVEPGDLLLQTTRPPLDDENHGGRKQVQTAGTDLETRLFKVWRRYLKICARSHVELHKSVFARLEPAFKTHKGMAFREARGAPYKELNALDGTGWKGRKRGGPTAAFLLRVDEAWRGGPGLIGAFGMDGVSTTVWTYRLGRDLSHLLRKPGFTVVQMQPAEVPKRITNLRWAMEWETEVMLQLHL